MFHEILHCIGKIERDLLLFWWALDTYVNHGWLEFRFEMATYIFIGFLVAGTVTNMLTRML